MAVFTFDSWMIKQCYSTYYDEVISFQLTPVNQPPPLWVIFFSKHFFIYVVRSLLQEFGPRDCRGCLGKSEIHRTGWQKKQAATQAQLKLPNTLFFKRFYLFIFRERGREWEMERNINWLPVRASTTGTERATQACALMGKRTHDFSLCQMLPKKRSHPKRGHFQTFLMERAKMQERWISESTKGVVDWNSFSLNVFWPLLQASMLIKKRLEQVIFTMERAVAESSVVVWIVAFLRSTRIANICDVRSSQGCLVLSCIWNPFLEVHINGSEIRG